MQNILQRMTQIMARNPKVTPLGNYNYCCYHNLDNHSINRCSTFRNLELTVKIDVLKKILIYFHCLGKKTEKLSCKENMFDHKMELGHVCGKVHHPKLYNLISQINHNEVNTHISKSENSTLLMIGQIDCK